MVDWKPDVCGINVVCFLSNTGVGDYINTMKTTFDSNFELYQPVKHISHEKLSILSLLFDYF